MTAVELEWEIEKSAPFYWVRAHGEWAYALTSRVGDLVAVSDGAIRWESAQVKRLVMGKTHLLVLKLPSPSAEGGRRWSIEALDPQTGERRWRRELVARSATRLFANGRGKAWVSVARFGQFILLELDEFSGEILREHVLERSKAVVAADGALVWTRDEMGVSSLNLVTDTRTQMMIDGDGWMSASGEDLYCTVGDTLVALRKSTQRWRKQFASRDLTPVARRDEVPVDETDDELWLSELGRPSLDPTRNQVLVAATNGILASLSTDDGRERWLREAEHYPASLKAHRPTVGEHWLAWPACDEFLYILDAESGDLLTSAELPGPVAAEPALVGNRVVLAMDRLRSFRVQV